MKIAFPTQFDHGLESPVFGHFGWPDIFWLSMTSPGLLKP